MRKIIHIDADCFFAAVEMRDDPTLREVPLAIGGQANARGVIATANYAAREYGVRSAMSSAKAVSLCPNLVLIRGNMEKYRLASRQMHAIFRDYTLKIEPLSLDEAYLDVTDCNHCYGSATLIAEEIRQRIYETVGITVSAGIAVNKFLAKVASDWNKPNGQFVVEPSKQEDFVRSIPVKCIHGVGRVTQEKLSKLKVETCDDLQKVDYLLLSQQFGSWAYRLQQLSYGIDERPVKSHSVRKSISVETTFAEDLKGVAACEAKLPDLLLELARRIKNKKGIAQFAKYYLKLKFSDFQQTTIETAYVAGDELAFFTDLLVEAYARRQMPVRLIGVGYRLKAVSERQLTLF
ncbi:MAG: DNA polymerase IV [Marinomonas sp.]